MTILGEMFQVWILSFPPFLLPLALLYCGIFYKHKSTISESS